VAYLVRAMEYKKKVWGTPRILAQVFQQYERGGNNQSASMLTLGFAEISRTIRGHDPGLIR